MTTVTTQFVNGIDTEALRNAVSEMTANPAKAQTRWSVSTVWKGGTRSDTQVEQCQVGGKTIKKDYTISADEPFELCGTNKFANPQEYLMAALNACMMVGYVSVCALEGIEVDNIRIDTQGEIDLRGFLGIDPNVKPGYESLRYDVHIKGKGTLEQFRKVHEIVTTTSPNRFNITNAIRLHSRLHIG